MILTKKSLFNDAYGENTVNEILPGTGEPEETYGGYAQSPKIFF